VRRTPLVVPSFSSKCVLQHWSTDGAMEKLSDLIAGPLLISAYDWHYQHVTKLPDSARPVFVDSGGYEALVDASAASRGEDAIQSKQPWNQALHEAALSKWACKAPTVFISYDHPDEPLPLAGQIARARAMAPERSDIVREFLVKPEKGATHIDVASLEASAAELATFDIIGVPDEEIGSSLKERAENVARLRKALSKVGAHTPIHVFGSLDPFISTLYFLSGADIFDGLAWLRYAFDEGSTLYLKQHRARRFWEVGPAQADITTFGQNYLALGKLQGAMREYLQGKDFRVFKFGGELEKAYNMIAEEIGD
jgi:hypothetical protein